MKYIKFNISEKVLSMIVSLSILTLIYFTAILVTDDDITVRFNTNGGSVVKPIQVSYQENIEVSQIPTREGYKFSGWYKDKSCNKKWDIKNDTVEETTILYAGWIKNANIE